MIEYVLGFMFSHDFRNVALILKNKPDWQKGLLNGIGGKMEPGELPIDAMIREFMEETGKQTQISDWRYFLLMVGNGFNVYCMASVGNLGLLKSTTEEAIQVWETRKFHPLSVGTVDNLPWLIPLAIDVMRDGRPSFLTTLYPK